MTLFRTTPRLACLFVFCTVFAASASATQLPTTTPFPVSMETEKFEVTSTITARMTQFVGWAENDPTGNNKHCAFSVNSIPNEQSWSSVLIRRAPGFDWALNPTVTSDQAGKLYAVCMSVMASWQAMKGRLEIATSSDDGVTWSDWTTIIEKEGMLPDKPWITTESDGSLILTYSAFRHAEKSTKESVASYITSNDGGAHWSEPRNLNGSLPNLPFKKDQRTIGDQGTSLAQTNNGLTLAAWGKYYGPIFFSKKPVSDSDFSHPILAAPSDFQAPVTQITSDPTGKNVFILWYGAHSFAKVSFIRSSDYGMTWSSPLLLSQSGTLASMAIDTSGRIHLIWTEVKRLGNPEKLHQDTRYAVSTDGGSGFNELGSLGGVPHPTQYIFSGGYLGAYQDLQILPEGRVRALWMDWRNGRSELLQSTWSLD